MRNLFMMASAAALAATMPVIAEAKPGNGQSARSGQEARQQARTRTRTDVRSNGRARTDARANARARARTGAAVDRRIDSDGDGIPDHRDRMTDRDRDGIDDRRQNRYGGADCPPGLANRTPACVPPGQARRMFREGQALPRSYRDYIGYQDLLGRLPESYRDDIPTGDYRYVYQNDSVYVVDNRTRLVRTIIDILR
jgi:hypothetical protein